MQSKLTTEELKWVKRLQKVLNQCPSSRIGFYTIGDPYIVLYDKDSGLDDDHSEKDFCQIVDSYGAGLGELTFPAPVLSTCG